MQTASKQHQAEIEEKEKKRKKKALLHHNLTTNLSFCRPSMFLILTDIPNARVLLAWTVGH